jgi:hypothetical protein
MVRPDGVGVMPPLREPPSDRCHDPTLRFQALTGAHVSSVVTLTDTNRWSDVHDIVVDATAAPLQGPQAVLRLEPVAALRFEAVHLDDLWEQPGKVSLSQDRAPRLAPLPWRPFEEQVVLGVCIDRQGKVTDAWLVRAARATPVEAAIEVLKGARRAPMTVVGQPVPVCGEEWTVKVVYSPGWLSLQILR